MKLLIARAISLASQLVAPFLLLASLAIAPAAFALDHDDVLDFPKEAASINEFVPKGYHIFASAEGDLNSDGLADVALIIVRDNDDPTAFGAPPNFPRFLVVALGQPNDRWKQLCVSKGGIMSGKEAENFALSVLEIKIDRGVLTVRQGNSATRICLYESTYNMQAGNLALVNISRSIANTRLMSSFTEDKNLITGLCNVDSQDGSEITPNPSQSYFEIRSPLTAVVPKIDGVVSKGEWPERALILAGAQSAKQHAAISSQRTAQSLYLLTRVTDCPKNATVTMTLVDSHQHIIPFTEMKSGQNSETVIEARYDMSKLKSCLQSGSDAPDSVAAYVRITLSSQNGRKNVFTSAKNKGAGSILLVRAFGLPTLADWDWYHPED